MRIKTTPFHPRLVELNVTGLWSHWAGHLSATRYDFSAKYEYFGIRNAAGFFDASPLFSSGSAARTPSGSWPGCCARRPEPEARPGAVHRLVRRRGFVLEDGVLFRHSADEFLLTAAEPNLSHLRERARGKQVEIVEVSEEYAVLALQGRAPAPSWSRSPPRSPRCPTSPHPGQGGRPPGHDQPHRLHRRPRLRADDPRRRRPRRPRRDPRGR
ncbi:MAG: hypothetical protein R2731_07905 [Nocardioides sp.]